jgi:cytochrome b subunit of formate dehydrogenase
MVQKKDSPDASVQFDGLRRLARITAWLLLAGIVILLVTGWGITQTGIIYRLSLGIIDRRMADFIHRGANVPLAVVFLAHVLINARLAISRKVRPHPRLVDAILIITGLIVLGIVVYMEYLV